MGGVLLVTPLKGIDGKVYALAQGPLVLGGFSAGGQAAQAQKNVTTSGLHPKRGHGGAGRALQVQFPKIPAPAPERGRFLHHHADGPANHTDTLYGDYARTLDISTIEITVPQEFANNLVPLLASPGESGNQPRGQGQSGGG